MKPSRKHIKGRMINIAISSMQFISTISSYSCMFLNLGQDARLGMILKMFVTLGIIVNVDDQFIKVLPKGVIPNGELLNKSKVLRMSVDYNTNKLLILRILKDENRDSVT